MKSSSSSPRAARPTRLTTPGTGLGVLLRADTVRSYTPPTRESIAGIDLHPTDVERTRRALADAFDVMRAHGDPRAVFPDVYGIITKNVAVEVQKGSAGIFKEPEWISRLTGFFAERYLEALHADLGGDVPSSRAWETAFSDGKSGHTFPVLDALLGINAHINFDLAQGLRDNIIAAGTRHDAERRERYKRDHDIINLVLRASMPEIFDRLETFYGCRVTQQVSRRGGRQHASDWMLGTLQRWREDVWSELEQLLDGTDDSLVIARMNESSERIAWSFSLGHERSMFHSLRPLGRAVAPIHRLLLPMRESSSS